MKPGASSGTLCRGFTLVELVVCIVLAAIVAAFMVLFLGAPVQAYFQETGRAGLVDSADRIAAAVTPDVRTALPNSLRVRWNAARTVWSLEFLQTNGLARYYGAGENQSSSEDLTPSPPGGSVSGFGTVDSFGTTMGPYLSVGNLGTAGHDAYAGTSPGTLTPPGTSVTVNLNPSSPLVAGENQVTLNPAMTFAADGLATPAHDAYLVQGPVSYVCDRAAGTLTRFWGYAVTAAQPLAFPPSTPQALIARDVSSCALAVFQDAPNPPTSPGYRFGEIAILDVTLSSGGESFQLFLEAPTEYSR